MRTIILKTNKTIPITEEQADRIWQDSCDPNIKGIELAPDNWVSFSMIARIEETSCKKLMLAGMQAWKDQQTQRDSRLQV